MVHSLAVGIVKSAYSPAGISLPPNVTALAKLNFGDGVGARAPELPVRHQAAEDLAVVLVRARIIHLDIGQPDTLFYGRVLAGRGELYFFLLRRPKATGQSGPATKGSANKAERRSEGRREDWIIMCGIF